MQCWRRPPLIFYFSISFWQLVFRGVCCPRTWYLTIWAGRSGGKNAICPIVASWLLGWPHKRRHTREGGEDGINFPHHPASLCITLASTSIASTHALTIPQTDRGGSWPWNPKSLRHQSSMNWKKIRQVPLHHFSMLSSIPNFGIILWFRSCTRLTTSRILFNCVTRIRSFKLTLGFGGRQQVLSLEPLHNLQFETESHGSCKFS